MRTAAVIQARMGSTRLPGKVLMDVRPGERLLSHLVERLQECRQVDEVTVATSYDSDDDVIENLLSNVYRGSADDVLHRTTGATRWSAADTIVRVTADCPLIDPAHIDSLIDHFRWTNPDYMIHTGVPDGFAAEIVRLETLERIHPLANEEEREHVTLYIRRRPEQFSLATLDMGYRDPWRLTVDTAEDLKLVRLVLGELPDWDYTYDDVRRVMLAHPEWARLNAHVPTSPVEVGVFPNVRQSDLIRDFQPALGDL